MVLLLLLAAVDLGTLIRAREAVDRVPLRYGDEQWVEKQLRTVTRMREQAVDHDPMMLPVSSKCPLPNGYSIGDTVYFTCGRGCVNAGQKQPAPSAMAEAGEGTSPPAAPMTNGSLAGVSVPLGAGLAMSAEGRVWTVLEAEAVGDCGGLYSREEGTSALGSLKDSRGCTTLRWVGSRHGHRESISAPGTGPIAKCRHSARYVTSARAPIS